jgi:hypothetical protein
LLSPVLVVAAASRSKPSPPQALRVKLMVCLLQTGCRLNPHPGASLIILRGFLISFENRGVLEDRNGDFAFVHDGIRPRLLANLDPDALRGLHQRILRQLGSGQEVVDPYGVTLAFWLALWQRSGVGQLVNG